MNSSNYKHEEIFLESYFAFCDEIEISVEAEIAMESSGVHLPDILQVFREPEVIWADRTHEMCEITVRGRNCDDEEVTVYGGIEAGTMRVSVHHVERARKK